MLFPFSDGFPMVFLRFFPFKHGLRPLLGGLGAAGGLGHRLGGLVSTTATGLRSAGSVVALMWDVTHEIYD